jgi:hypothetical protein
MPFIPTNFPDQVWSALKAWAQVQAASRDVPTIEECAAYVKRAAEAISGHPGALRTDVVAFYADETREMIAKYREQFLAADAEQAG